MAQLMKELPRDLQSDLHNMADKIGERVALNEMVEVSLAGHIIDKPQIKCTCNRYSERIDGEYVKFWNVSDPDCQYIHLQPLPRQHTIHLP